MEDIEKKLRPENDPEITPSPIARRLLDILPDRSGNKILEIGAREADLEGKHIGDDCIYLAQEENDVTLVETGQGIIDNIKKRVTELGVGAKVDFLVSQFDHLSLASDQFDASFSLAGLDATYLPLGLKEMCRVLKSSGKALIFIYFKMGGKLIQGPEDALEKYILDSGLQIDSKQIKVIDREQGLEAIIFELHK